MIAPVVTDNFFVVVNYDTFCSTFEMFDY